MRKRKIVLGRVIYYFILNSMNFLEYSLKHFLAKHITEKNKRKFLFVNQLIFTFKRRLGRKFNF